MTDHKREDHVIGGGPEDQARAVIARHLCGWITGHTGPVDHFIADAEMILHDLRVQGLRVRIAPDLHS